MPWSYVKAEVMVSGNPVAGTTGIENDIVGNVVAGQMVFVWSMFYLNAGDLIPTFSDSNGNVTEWTTLSPVQRGGHAAGQEGYNHVAFAIGVATTTGPCTPKVTWNTASTGWMGLGVSVWNVPVGVSSVVQDGTVAYDYGAPGVPPYTIDGPTGDGTGNNEPILFYLSTGSNITGFGASWTECDITGSDAYAYAIGTPTSTPGDATQTDSSAGWEGYLASVKAVDDVLTTPRVDITIDA